MDYNKIRKLLNKYWNAGTSLDEETILKDFFSEFNNIPDDLKGEQALFKFYQREIENVPVNNEFIKSNTLGKLKLIGGKKLNISRRVLKMAAVFMFLVLISFFYYLYKGKRSLSVVIADTEKDPKKVQYEAKETLYQLSVDFNDGLSALSNDSEEKRSENTRRKN